MKGLSPNVVFITIVVAVFGCMYVGWKEFRAVQHQALVKECAEFSLELLGAAHGDGTSFALKYAKLCVDVGGQKEALKWLSKGTSS